jgi:hypothetical protein
MHPITILIDGYERKARLYPALVLLASPAVTALALLSPKMTAIEAVGALVVTCGGAFFLSQIARDVGKREEQGLFSQWDGMPSISILRHRDTRINSITKAHYHKKLESFVKGTKAPSAAEEAANPVAADLVYSAWSTYLRVNARDTKKFPLLFQENISYGYRRNIWGMRPIGILFSCLSIIMLSTMLYIESRTPERLNPELIGALVFSSVLLFLWVYLFKPRWVRVPADAYAERLVETVHHVCNRK